MQSVISKSHNHQCAGVCWPIGVPFVFENGALTQVQIDELITDDKICFYDSNAEDCATALVEMEALIKITAGTKTQE